MSNPVEIRLGHVLPGLFVIGALVNLALTTPNWDRRGFARVALHASGQADYSPDSPGLIFAPVDPDIIEEVKGDGSDSSIENTEFSQPSAPTQIPVTTPSTMSTPTISITEPPQPTHMPTFPRPPLPTNILPDLPLPIDLPELPDLPAIPELPDIPALPGPPESLDSPLDSLPPAAIAIPLLP